MITEKIKTLDINYENRLYYDTEITFLEEYLEIGKLYKSRCSFNTYEAKMLNGLYLGSRHMIITKNDIIMFLGNEIKENILDFENNHYKFLLGKKIFYLRMTYGNLTSNFLDNIERIN